MKDFMEEALNKAKIAYKKNEVPIGAVIVRNNKIISSGYNIREKSKNAINHAEIIAIVKACKKLHSWRLDDCEMYVTLKPCPMCAGAIVNSRIKTVFYGAESDTDENNLCEQILSDTKRLNHKTNLFFLKNDGCIEIIKHFFEDKRKK